MSTDKILGDRYRVGAVVGHGAFSVVYECKDMETHTKYAVKVLSKARVRQSDMEEAFEREAMALKTLTQCPYVTRAVDILQSTRNYYVVMDLADKGSLLQLVVKTNGGHGLPAHAVRRYFTQLMQGVRYMHACNVAHRDIKPENLLLDEWRNLKISDFGFAAKAPPERVLKRQCGTPQYVAPEVLRGDGYNGQKADIWSCGVTLYVLLCGHLPFAAHDHERLFELIQDGRYPAPRRPDGLAPVPPSALHLLKCCLAMDPRRRWAAERILKHPYLAGFDEMPCVRPRGNATAAAPPTAELGVSWDPDAAHGGLLGGGDLMGASENSDDRGCRELVTQRHSCPNLSELPRLGIDIFNDPQLGRKRSQPLRKLFDSCHDVSDLPGASASEPPEAEDERREGLGNRNALKMLRQTSFTEEATPLPGMSESATPADFTPVRSKVDSRSAGEIFTPTRRPSSRNGSTSHDPRSSSRPSTTPHDPARFAVPVQRRFQLVHVWMGIQFVLVLGIVILVALLKLVFDVKLQKLPLPRSIRKMVENLVDSAGFGEHGQAAPPSSPGPKPKAA